MVVALDVPAHDLSRIQDCTTVSCPNEATEKGPGGNPYCSFCKTQIYQKKVATTTERHGGAGGGTLRKALVDAERADVVTDTLARRLRTELKLLERAVDSRSEAERKVRDARDDCAKTLRAIVGRVNELAETPRP